MTAAPGGIGGGARDRLARTGRTLSRTAIAGSALWALAVAAAFVALLAAADAVIGLPLSARIIALPVVAGAALLAARRTWRRGRASRSPSQVALWIEERMPSLRYALATLADPLVDPGNARRQLESIVAAASWSDEVRRTVVRAVLGPAVVLAVAAPALIVLPGAALTRVAAPRAGDAVNAPGYAGARRGSILAPLAVVVTPPVYTHRAAETFEEPVSVTGLTGSDVVVQGRGSASRIRALLGDSAVASSADGGRWQVRFRMPASARALRLTDGAAERLVTIEPYPDSAPVVVLRTPARDTVLRQPSGSVPLAAAITDDIGLTEVRFDYIITSGEMESFTFRTGTVSRTTLAGARSNDLRGALALPSLALKPGDIIHVRAVASDGYAAGHGASETRTIRIARQGEYDSVDVEGLPSIIGDTAALSQRMLILLAEALERHRPHLGRDTVVAESRDIARDQARLRRRVADIVFMRVSGETPGEESDADSNRPTTPEQVLAAAESAASRNANAATDFSADESPVVAVNRPLLEAYNAMWEAGRWLEIGEPDDALPHMRAALAAIQRARQAERIYLRGRPPTQVVDLRDARLKGDRAPASSSVRLPAAALGVERSRLAARLGAAASIARASPAGAADSLLLLRLSALERYPAFAAAVGRAAARLRAGGDATADFLRARDALMGAPRHAGMLPAWSAAP